MFDIELCEKLVHLIEGRRQVGVQRALLIFKGCDRLFDPGDLVGTPGRHREHLRKEEPI
jgi:hypothetical protein